MIRGDAVKGFDGARGFDCNQPVTLADAQHFKRGGYDFALRYVPRVTARANDLTEPEVLRLHMAGLAVMPVQHVESEKHWTPDAAKGTLYGKNGASHAVLCGIAPGVTMWLDLEAVDKDTPDQDIIDYCNAWYDEVLGAGFEPGIYVGDSARLSADQLYYKLRFTRYWSAYNLNSDAYPAVRGVCMRQHSAKSPAYITFPIDSDIIQTDALGDVPTLCAPYEWCMV